MNKTTPERLARIVDVMVLVQQDCAQEAAAIDGKPFDGRTVAEQFGNMLAEIKAVAEAVEVLAQHIAAEMEVPV